MRPTIRAYKPSEEETGALSLRAWEPVFAAVEKPIGSELLLLLRGDWRTGQAKQVRDVLADPANRVCVAEADCEAVCFVAATLHHTTGIGEIYIIAVDPRHQGAGTGSALTKAATDWFRASGTRVAMIETGGDPGHMPARRVYEKPGYRALPAVRFFKAL